jgi:hypothetical protein
MGKCPAMVEVITLENNGVRPRYNTIESRRNLLRVAIYHGLISTSLREHGAPHKLYLTPKGVAYLRRYDCAIEPPLASPSPTPES